jgi:chromosome segregation ATPase
METVIAALITGIVGVFGACFGFRYMLDALKKQLETHEKDSEGRKSGLSKEHDGLSKTLDSVKGTVTYLKEERLKEAGRQEALKGQELDARNALYVLEAHASQAEALRAELAAAKEEIAALKQAALQGPRSAEFSSVVKENAALCQENQRLRRRVEQLTQEQESEGPDWEEPEL